MNALKEMLIKVIDCYHKRERAKQVLDDAFDALREQELKVDLAKKGLHEAQFNFNRAMEGLDKEYSK